jgi:hypothetical protein
MSKIKPIVIAFALMLLPTWTSAEPVTKLAQLPPIVQEHVRSWERGCGGLKPDYRLSEIVHVRSLSGPRTRDYIVDARKFGCRHDDGYTSYTSYCGSGGCAFTVYLQRHGEWSDVGGDLAMSWYTIRRPGKKTVLVIKRRCYGSLAECRGRGNNVLQITRNAVTEKEIRR